MSKSLEYMKWLSIGSSEDIEEYIRKNSLQEIFADSGKNFLMQILTSQNIQKLLRPEQLSYIIEHSDLSLVDRKREMALNYILAHSLEFGIDKFTLTEEQYLYIIEKTPKSIDEMNKNPLKTFCIYGNSVTDNIFEKLIEKFNSPLSDSMDCLTYLLMTKKKLSQTQWNMFIKKSMNDQQFIFLDKICSMKSYSTMYFLIEIYEDRQNLLNVLEEKYNHIDFVKKILTSEELKEILIKEEKKSLNNFIENIEDKKVMKI